MAGLSQSDPTFVPVVIPGAESGVTSVALSPAHLCIVQDGAVRCLGRNDEGQLGDGTKTPSRTWVPAHGLTSGIATVAVGSEHSCAASASGELFCWGEREAQPQPGSYDVLTPTLVTGVPSPVVKVVAAGSTTAVLMTNQKMKVWHAHLHEIDALFVTEEQADAALNNDLDLFGPHITDIALGNSFGCMIKGGEAYCWGENSYGQLGDGTMRDRAKPTRVSGLTDVSSVVAGASNACAVANGTAWCWGSNLSGQVGTGKSSADAAWFASPQRVANLPGPVTSITPGISIYTDPDSMTCATAAENMYCWGDNRAGQAGTGDRFGNLLAPSVPAGVGVQPGFGVPITIRVVDKDGNAATTVWTPTLSN